MKVTITITQKWEFKTEAHSLALAKERAKELMKITEPKLTIRTESENE